MTYNVFIRGIYSTALTKIFKDANYKIIFPSTAILQRFPDLKEFDGSYSKDIIINDRYDKEGVSVSIKKEVWEKIKDTFPLNHDLLPDTFILPARFPLNSISKGIVIQSNKMKNFSLVRLTPEVNNESANVSDNESNFTTTIGRINKFLKIGTEDIFQVTFEDFGKNYAFLNQGYTVSGDLAVIMPYNKRGFISKKIKDKEQRKKLNGVIEKVTIKDFGILLRTAAQFASEIEILKEIQRLRDTYLDIEAKINQTKSTIGMISSNYVSINYVFTQESKLKLDEIRSSVSPTIAFHHSIKSNSGTISLQLKAMNLLESTMDELKAKVFSEKINNNFIAFYYNNLYNPKQFLNINHNKINGRNIPLTPGIIKKIERDRSVPNKLKIILRRNLSGKGTYDGLDLPIEEGDYAIGVYGSGDMYYETLYYSAENELKGRYFNINTPIFLSANAINYFDLEIDVIEPLNKSRKIIDQSILDKALSMNIISKTLYEKAIQMAKKIESGEIKSELEKIAKPQEIVQETTESASSEELDSEQEKDDEESEDEEYEEIK